MLPKGQKAPHGTTSRYRRHKCRCDECRAAQTTAARQRREDLRPAHVRPRPSKPAEHGTRSMYRRCNTGYEGGKCEPCRKANRDYMRIYMQDRRAGITWGREDPAFA